MKALVGCLDKIDANDLPEPVGLLSRLVLGSSAFAAQFIQAGGLQSTCMACLLKDTNPPGDPLPRHITVNVRNT